MAAAWRYDIQELSSAVFTVYAFAFWAPLLVRAAMAYVGAAASALSFAGLICVWGYGLAPYVGAAVSTIVCAGRRRGKK